MFELRWVLPAGTTTKSPILQYRTKNPGPWGMGEWSLWQNVPYAVVPTVEFSNF